MSKHQIQPGCVCRMSRLTRDGTAEPVSRDQILRHVRGQGNIHFPSVHQLTTSRIGNLTRLIHTLLIYMMTKHTLRHTTSTITKFIVNFVFALSQLQGVEWGWPGRREPDDEHSPASKGRGDSFLFIFFVSYIVYFVVTQLPSLERLALLSFWGFPALTCFLFF